MSINKQRYVSAQDVARRAGVSRSAVSRSFTPGASVSAETYTKVMAAAQELGYQVNDLARGLLANSSRLVGLGAMRMPVTACISTMTQRHARRRACSLRTAENRWR